MVKVEFIGSKISSGVYKQKFVHLVQVMPENAIPVVGMTE
jgi:hypothetical protein